MSISSSSSDGVDAIVRLNCNYPEIWPKTWPATIVPQVAAQSFTWTLKAINKNGILYVEATTGSPFRAQQGQIHVYSAQDPFRPIPRGRREPGPGTTKRGYGIRA